MEEHADAFGMPLDDPFARAASASLSTTKAFGHFLLALLVALLAALWAVLWSTARVTSRAAAGVANSFGWSRTALPEYSGEPRGLYPGQALEDDVEVGIISESFPIGCPSEEASESVGLAPSEPTESSSPLPAHVVMQLPTPQQRMGQNVSSCDEAEHLEQDAARSSQLRVDDDRRIAEAGTLSVEEERIAAEKKAAEEKVAVETITFSEEKLLAEASAKAAKEEKCVAQAALEFTEMECVAADNNYDWEGEVAEAVPIEAQEILQGKVAEEEDIAAGGKARCPRRRWLPHDDTLPSVRQKQQEDADGRRQSDGVTAANGHQGSESVKAPRAAWLSETALQEARILGPESPE